MVGSGYDVGGFMGMAESRNGQGRGRSSGRYVKTVYRVLGRVTCSMLWGWKPTLDLVPANKSLSPFLSFSQRGLGTSQTVSHMK